MPAAPPTTPAREQFLAAVRAANLFAPMQLARVEAAVPPEVATPADAARLLVSAGHLTRFQAERLLAGRTDGFHLGPYVILEQVGCGATGRVYKARHQTLNRLVAVKVLTPEFTRAAARRSIEAEVRAAAQLNHPNVVTAYDANRLADRFYLVLEFVDGPNFETVVKERGPLPVAEACELGRQAADGLAHAHERGMIHRDVKPSNLLVARPSKCTPEPLVKIADFGLARLSPAGSLSATPMPSALARSAEYAAPETAHDPQAIDHRADIYSLGAVLYFLLTGRSPFGDDPAGRVRAGEPPRLESLRPDVPPALAALVHQMLAKHPDHRPVSALEVGGRLGAVAAACGEMVCFDLPAVQVGPYSFVNGQPGGATSGRYPVPEMNTPPGAACDPVPDTSPWQEIEGVCDPVAETTGFELNLAGGGEPTRRRGRYAGTFGVLGAGVLLLCLLSVGVLAKLLAK